MVNGSKTKNPIAESILLLYTLGYLILSVLPMVKYSVPYVISGLYCLLFLLYYFIKGDNEETTFVNVLIITFFGLIQGFVAYLNENARLSEIINEPIRVLRIIIPCFIFYSISGISKRKKLFLWLFLTVLFAYISVTTLNALSTNSMLARDLASGSQDEYLTAYRLRNVGGFEFSYAFGLMLPLFIILIFNAKNVFIKIFSVGVTIYIFYYILAAQYMILFIIGFISVFLIIILGSYKPHIKLIAILLPVLFIFIMSPVLRWIATFDVGTLMRNRLLSVADFFDGKVNVGTTSSRVELYKNALNAFLYNPIFGQYSSQAAYESHSLILGTAASTGIMGLTFLIVEFAIYYKTNKTSMQKLNVNVMPFKVSFACYIILAFLNPIGYAYEIAIVIFLYVPLTVELFFHNNQKRVAINDEFKRGLE